MGDGRALQAGTSHNLGQNFAKAFDIQFQGRDKSLQYAWTTSWGVTTRLVGAVIMAHGDDSGLILPPRVAPWQVAIVPIPRGNWKETVLPKCEEIRDQLRAAGIRVKLDADDSNTPGWKFSEYEMRGVPLRLEIGPKDIEKASVFAARRDTRAKQSLPMDGLTGHVSALLEEIQANLLARARAFRESHTAATDQLRRVQEHHGGAAGLRAVALVRVGAVRGGHQGRDAGDHSQRPLRLRAGARPAVHQVQRTGGRDRVVCQSLLIERI